MLRRPSGVIPGLRATISLTLAAASVARPVAAQTPREGGRLFQARCAYCHGTDGAGGEFAPGILDRLPTLDDQALEAVVRNGLPERGMPPFELSPGEMSALLRYLRTLRPEPRPEADAPPLIRVETTTGTTLEGTEVNRSFEDLQLRTADGRVRLLRPAAGGRYRAVTSQVDWPSYDGSRRGYRRTPADEITPDNVTHLAPRWIFTFEETSPLETTPVVVDGIMYVTSANQCYALDAGTGRALWHYRRPLSDGLVGNARNGINRGVAVDGRRVFMMTDDAHLLALDRFTGALLWETTVADWHENYSATAAPLVAGGMVITGTAGGDAGARGFLAAYDPATGEEAWRFWTVPAPGEPGSETWEGEALAHPGAVTWLTGSYDPELETVYWATGNPGSDLNGDVRRGDNLYSDAVIALDVHTGMLKWYYQFTPHDEWDYDAQEPLALVDADWDGRPRRLLVQANRNGFFYVLDRADGELLLARPFARRLTWAREIDPDGRPVRDPAASPTAEGTVVCPSLIGATNWWSTAYVPERGLYVVQTLESCGVFRKRLDTWTPGQVYMGGGTSRAPGEPPKKILRALDLHTGAPVWELPQTGSGSTRSGVLATATGLVFFGEDSGAFVAADVATGEVLWHFQTSQTLRASPMSYVFDDEQLVALASGPNVIVFGLAGAR